jgi:hypothetical protein
MTKHGIRQSGTPPERDEVDEWFDALLKRNEQEPEQAPQPRECKIEEIDPSKPGWEIKIFFDNNDPNVSDSQAEEDLEAFRQFQALGIARCEYRDKAKTVALSHLEGCCEDELDELHLKTIRRYRHVAKTLPENRRTDREDRIEAAVKSSRDSAGEILAGVTRGLAARPPVIHELPPTRRSAGGTLVIEPQAQNAAEKHLEVPDDILITIPAEGTDLNEILAATGCKSLSALLEKLEDIADEEELCCEHGEADGLYIVNIYKNPNIGYHKPMDAKNMALIMKLPFEKVGLVNPDGG